MGGDGHRRARFDEVAAKRLCEELYWEPTEIRALIGWADANFRVRDGAGREFVLKIAAPTVERDQVDLQIRALQRLSSTGVANVPRVVPSRFGRELEVLETDGAPAVVHMLTFLRGPLLAELPARPPRVLSQLGRLLARVDMALSDLQDPAAQRPNEWDIARLEEMPEISDAIEGVAERRRAEDAIGTWVDLRAAAGDGLRRGLIHNDGNEHNVVVDSLDPETAGLVGLIDFGDLVESDLVVEAAVGMAYAGIEASDPWGVAMPLLAGYDSELQLTDEELGVLLPAVRARLALSVSMSARRRAMGDADEYALISEASAWAALRRLERMSPVEALVVTGEALGREVRDV